MVKASSPPLIAPWLAVRVTEPERLGTSGLMPTPCDNLRVLDGSGRTLVLLLDSMTMLFSLVATLPYASQAVTVTVTVLSTVVAVVGDVMRRWSTGPGLTVSL